MLLLKKEVVVFQIDTGAYVNKLPERYTKHVRSPNNVEQVLSESMRHVSTVYLKPQNQQNLLGAIPDLQR